MSSWKMLSVPYNEQLSKGIGELHTASQFVGMFGNAFVPKKNDDSHTNLAWVPDEDQIIGRSFQNTKAFLNVQDWTLGLTNEKKGKTHKTEIAAKTKQDLLSWFHQNLNNFELTPSSYQYFQHFDLPDYHFQANSQFEHLSIEVRQALICQMHNACITLNQIVQEQNLNTEIRIWPHHFDMGSLIPLAYDNNQMPTKTIGLGWANPDNEIPEPYFYINFWSKYIDFSSLDLPQLKTAGSWHQQSWIGMILTYTDILSASDQYQTVKQYFDEGISTAQSILEE